MISDVHVLINGHDKAREKSPFPGMAMHLCGPTYVESSRAQCPEWDEPRKDQLPDLLGNFVSFVLRWSPCRTYLTVKTVHTSKEQETQHSNNVKDP